MTKLWTTNWPYIANADFRIVKNHDECSYFRRFWRGRLPQSRPSGSAPGPRGHISYYSTVRGLDILHNVIVSGNVTFCQINKFFFILFFVIGKMSSWAAWNGFAGRIWHAGRSLETPGLNECKILFSDRYEMIVNPSLRSLFWTRGFMLLTRKFDWSQFTNHSWPALRNSNGSYSEVYAGCFLYFSLFFHGFNWNRFILFLKFGLTWHSFQTPHHHHRQANLANLSFVSGIHCLPYSDLIRWSMPGKGEWFRKCH